MQFFLAIQFFHSPCTDKKKSARKEGLYYSITACSGNIKEEPPAQVINDNVEIKKKVRKNVQKKWKKNKRKRNRGELRSEQQTGAKKRKNFRKKQARNGRKGRKRQQTTTENA